MNERQFINDGKDYYLPIQLIIGASNELPNEDLDALYDRFLIR
jgi:MoxR-like ATPase